MEFNHKPVLLDECLEALNIKPDGTYIDCTLGGAGHSSEIFKRLGFKGLLIGIDQDSTALEASRQRLQALNGQARLILVNRNFRYIADICRENEIQAVDGILMDLGVSSYQLDEAERGFSYQKDAPLDMRMDRGREFSACNVVNEYSEDRLKEIIRDYGEEKWASRVAAFIVKYRQESRIETTGQLVEIIKAAIPSGARREGPHPAKRTFQAIRIEVNGELEVLKEAIDEACSILAPEGRLCIITFHSLEDRIVKNSFMQKVNPCTCPREFPVCICGKKPVGRLVTRKPMLPTDRELEENPRARSSKLRVLEKI